MIITLTGDNGYQISAELKKLIEQIGNLNVTNLFGGESTLEDIKLELPGYSLFSEKRLIVLEQPSKIKGFDEYIIEGFASLPEDSVIVIIEPSLDRRKSYYKFLKNKTDFKELKKPALPELNKWLMEYVAEQGGTTTKSNADYLIGRVGDDQLLLSKEVDKLILYSKDISKNTIDLLTEPSASSTIFELLDAAFNLNLRKALGIYADQRLQKVEPEQILAMMSWQLNSLAIYMTSKNLSTSQVLSVSGLSPYTLSKARQISSNLSFSNLKVLVSELAKLDYRSKTTTFDLDEGLKNFIVGLSY